MKLDLRHSVLPHRVTDGVSVTFSKLQIQENKNKDKIQDYLASEAWKRREVTTKWWAWNSLFLHRIRLAVLADPEQVGLDYEVIPDQSQYDD